MVSWTRRRNHGQEKARVVTNRKPVARSEDLIVEELGDELLVYDLTRDRAHSLGAVAARVWRACDGETTVESLSSELQLDADTVARALGELGDCHLLEVEAATDDGLTRRDMSVKAVKIGAAVAAVPLIVSVVAPTAAQAVTEKFCQTVTVTSAGGCGDCHKFGCCCCFPPGGTTKPCHADCAPSDCLAGANCNGSSDNCKQKPPS